MSAECRDCPRSGTGCGGLWACQALHPAWGKVVSWQEKPEMSETPPDSTPKPTPEAPQQAAEIEFDDFVKVELKTGRVTAAEVHPDADKLLVLKVQCGDEERTVCAGIRQWWAPEDLVGKDIVLVANLKPRKLRGVLSQGMLLAVQDGDNVVPLTAMKPVASGLRVT